MINNKLIAILLVTCVVILVSCNSVQSDSSESQSEVGLISEKSTEELVQILERAEDVNDPAFNLFLDVVEELKKRGQSASEAAPTLAKAIAYKRRDSDAAGKALIPMGQSASNAIPILLQNLDNEREDVRRYSIFNLGYIGKPAECSIPKISSLLWDKDPGVRSAAAVTIEAITKVDLVWDYEEIDPELYGSVNMDDPEGSVTQKARTWWQETGQNMKWSTENCVPVQ
jgi:HEAT repeat protein